MEENKITIGDMVVQMISNGQLSDEEETRILDMIVDKQARNCSKSICLAEAVESGMVKKIENGIAAIKEMHDFVLVKCFKETAVGNMDSLELSEEIIRKFDEDVRKSFGLSRSETAFFVGMLRAGLNKMAADGALNFDPNVCFSSNTINSRQEILYIDNPYTEEETQKIMQWVQGHPADVRGIAVSLWFMKGISLTEIVNLTKKDCWGGVRTEQSSMKFKETLFKSSARSQIVWKSLYLHPRTVKEVFVIPKKDGSGWKKLTEWGLQKKLRHICKDIGIEYKGIRENEAIRL